MGRYLPTECEDCGGFLDWGDFGAEDGSSEPTCTCDWQAKADAALLAQTCNRCGEQTDSFSEAQVWLSDDEGGGRAIYSVYGCRPCLISSVDHLAGFLGPDPTPVDPADIPRPVRADD